MTGIETYDYPHVDSVVVCGDIHGEFEQLIHTCCVKYRLRDTLVVVAGDCGFGFRGFPYYLNLLYGRHYDRLQRSNVYLAFVRGNHDDPSYFRDKLMFAEHFRAVADYSVLTACGHRILCVGGAVSIDRALRRESVDWWRGEVPVYRREAVEALEAENLYIDTVVTHTAPSFCEFTVPSGHVYGEDLLGDMKLERSVMDVLLERLRHDGHPLRRWYYGHFHHSWNADIGGVRYTMLDIMEMKEIV